MGYSVVLMIGFAILAQWRTDRQCDWHNTMSQHMLHCAFASREENKVFRA